MDVQKILNDLGLTESEVRVYLYLAKGGLKKARELAEALNMNRRRLYRSLIKMQNRNIVQASSEYPAQFSAVPFEKVLDLFTKANIEEAKQMIKNKKELLSIWRSMAQDSLEE